MNVVQKQHRFAAGGFVLANGTFGATLMPDNKIVLAGFADQDVAVVRYLDN